MTEASALEQIATNMIKNEIKKQGGDLDDYSPKELRKAAAQLLVIDPAGVEAEASHSTN